MNKWNQYNLFGAISGLSILIICVVYIKSSPILLLPSAFSLGICYKCINNIIKGAPKKDIKKSTTELYNRSINNKKKKKKSK
ncbi:MAG: hypothetical protein ACRDB0_03200 [Paraclostridium sp.]